MPSLQEYMRALLPAAEYCAFCFDGTPSLAQAQLDRCLREEWKYKRKLRKSQGKVSQ